MLKLGETTLIERVIRRAQLTGYTVILATTVNKEDDVLEETAKKCNINCFRGSESNVLERAVLAAEKNGLEAFARLCGDRPLFSIEEMKEAINQWKLAKPDLVTNNYTYKCLKGTTTEIIKTSSLRAQLNDEPNTSQQEHVTFDFYKQPEQYNILSIKPQFKFDNNDSGLAIDTIKDYEKISSKFNINK